MTNDYHIILPLMVAVVVSTAIAQHVHPESIYTLKLIRRGIRLARGRDVDVMDSVKVEEIMRRNPVTVYASMPASALGDLFLQTNSHGFPVVDRSGRLKGIVSLTDLRSAREAVPEGKALKVKDVANQNLVVTYPDESVRMALRRMAPRDLSRLPVVSREDPTRLLGIVRRNDVIRAYEIGTLRRSECTARVRADALSGCAGSPIPGPGGRRRCRQSPQGRRTAQGVRRDQHLERRGLGDPSW